MVGIGPFLSQKDTPFAHYENGSGELTLFLLAVIRLLLPKVLLPSTTALRTLLAAGKGMGHCLWRKCYHAKPFSYGGTEKVYPL